MARDLRDQNFNVVRVPLHTVVGDGCLQVLEENMEAIIANWANG